MRNGARDWLHSTLVTKCIFMGLLKVGCLYNGLTLSHLHSGFTFFSLCFEVISALVVCIEDTSSRIQKHDTLVSAARTNTVGSFFKLLATLVTHIKELEEITTLCSVCTFGEIVLVVFMFCCWCCIDEPKRMSSKMKQSA